MRDLSSTLIRLPPSWSLGKEGAGRVGEIKYARPNKGGLRINGAWGWGCPASQEGHSTPGAALGRKGRVPFPSESEEKELNVLLGYGLQGKWV